MCFNRPESIILIACGAIMLCGSHLLSYLRGRASTRRAYNKQLEGSGSRIRV